MAEIAILFDNLGPYHRARLKEVSKRCQVTAIEFGSESGEYRWAREDWGGFRSICLNPQGAGKMLPLADFKSRLEEALTTVRPDVVAIPGWSGRGAFLAKAWCGRRGVPVIVMSDSTAWDAPRKMVGETIKRRYVRTCSAGFVAGSAHADYLAQLGLPRERTVDGYDVVDNEYFMAGAARAKGGPRPIGRPYFLASARFVAKKNLPTLLRAYANYRQRAGGQFFDLMILGDGPMRRELKVLASELDIESSLHWPGFRQYEELPTYYAWAQAFIQASTVDQWGLVVNEAMASGLPVLVSDRCGCAGDLVDEGENGWTFNPYVEDDLAKRLTEIGSVSAEKRTEMGANSQRIIGRWGLERFANGLLRASEMARQEGPKPLSWLDGLLLMALSRR